MSLVVWRHVKANWFNLVCLLGVVVVVIWRISVVGLHNIGLVWILLLALPVAGFFRLVEFLIIAYYFIKWDRENYLDVRRLRSEGDVKGIQAIFSSFCVLGYELYDLRNTSLFSIFQDANYGGYYTDGYLPMFFAGSCIESVLGDRYLKYIRKDDPFKG